MSVFTRVEPGVLLPWLQQRGIRELHHMAGISGGTVNTNYWLTTDQGDWVLTLIEDRPAESVRPVMTLMHQLSEQGLPTPAVRADSSGERVGVLHERPVTLVQALPGEHPTGEITEARQAGEFLARLHQATLDLPPLTLNFGPDWQRDRAADWITRLPPQEAALMQDVAADTDRLWQARAPYWSRAWVHGDLFADNVLIHEGRLSAVIDWYFASTGPCIWDLAVTLNAWYGALPLSAPGPAAMLSGYQALASLSADEARDMPALRRSAALRFWLSRLDAEAAASARPDCDQITVKPPTEYSQLLLDLPL